MVEEQKLLKAVAAKTGFSERLLIKDYYLTKILYAIKDVEDIYFKGGTALNKILLDHARLSEDIDFTVKNVVQARKDIQEAISNIDFITDISTGKDVEGFVRIICTYNTFNDQTDTVFIDINERARAIKKPKKLTVQHFYDHLPTYDVLCLDTEEMIAEKVATAIQRNKPRDHYDIYQIIKHELPINIPLAVQKCEQKDMNTLIINMFKNGKKLYNRWDEDMIALLREPVSFQEVMSTNAEYFKLHERKQELSEKE